MIGLPYPKYMNSNNDVDMARGDDHVLGRARPRRSGVPEIVGCSRTPAPTATSTTSSRNRWPFTDTPAIELGGRLALELAGVGIDDIALVDLYSCFPSAVQLGAAALGLDARPPAHRTGGLPFAGGPWNNYVMHAIATVVDDLRGAAGRARAGLGERRVRDQARVRRVLHRAAGCRVPS